MWIAHTAHVHVFNRMLLFSLCSRYQIFTAFCNRVFSMMPLFVLLCLLIRQMKYRLILICIFIHSIGMCRIRRFLAILRSFFHSSLLCTFSCHPSPPTILPSSLTPSCHLFLGLPLSLVVPKFIYNNLLGILFSSILCTCPNQHNLFNHIVSVIVSFFNTCINFFIS